MFLQLAERSLEDHESVLQVYRSWGHTEDNRFYFRKDFRKYEFFHNPSVSLQTKIRIVEKTSLLKAMYFIFLILVHFPYGLQFDHRIRDSFSRDVCKLQLGFFKPFVLFFSAILPAKYVGCKNAEREHRFTRSHLEDKSPEKYFAAGEEFALTSWSSRKQHCNSVSVGTVYTQCTLRIHLTYSALWSYTTTTICSFLF